MEIDFWSVGGGAQPDPKGKRMVATDAILWQLALASLPAELKHMIEEDAVEIVRTLCVTMKDIEVLVDEVAGDLNLTLKASDQQLIIRRLLDAHLKADYLDEKIRDHLGEQIEETIRELQPELGEEEESDE